MKYFEVVFGTDDERYEADWIAYKGTRVPTVEEARIFLKDEIERFGEDVAGVYELTECEVKSFYDCSDIENWKTFA